MKSIVEEASSISKAIEKGWVKAGSPKEFSVKIYEDAEKNFFGITTKPAKIGIFFEEGRERKFGSETGSQYQQKPQYQKGGAQQTKPYQKQNIVSKQKPEKTEKFEQKKQPDLRDLKQKQEFKSEAKQSFKPQAHKFKEENINQERPDTDKIEQVSHELKTKPLWTESMIESASSWLNNLLSQTEYNNVKFDISADKYYLKINFNAPICKDMMKERQLFASISLLLMQTIKKRFENPFKGYKVILMRNESGTQTRN